jgi:hypothetical protein
MQAASAKLVMKMVYTARGLLISKACHVSRSDEVGHESAR